MLDTFLEMSENFSTDKEERENQVEMNPDLFPRNSASDEIFDPGDQVLPV